MSPADRRRRLFLVLAPAAAFAVCVGLSVGLPAYAVFVATSVLVSTVLLLGLGIVTGTAGVIALCQFTFAAIGAWVLEFLTLRTPWAAALGDAAFPLFMLVGGVVSAGFGIIVGLPALRLRGVNLAVITLGVAAAADMTLQKIAFPDNWTATRIPRPFGLGFDPESDRGYFLFTAAVTILIALGLHILKRSRWGTGWKSVAFSERGTASAGTSVRIAKLSAFAVSAFVGGIGGALIVGQISQVNYVTFQAVNSLGLYVLSIVVGSHLIDMALLGGILFVLIPELLKQLRIPLEWSSVVFGVLGIQALAAGQTLGEKVRSALRRRASPQRIEPVAELPKPSLFTSRGTGRVLLEVERLTVDFAGVKALSNVSMSLEEGTILGLIGPNGAGKSTFVDALSGFLPDHGGTIKLNGRPLEGMPPHRRARAGLRRTFQQDRVPTTVTVRQYTDFISRGSADGKAIDAALAFFGCPSGGTLLAEVDAGTRRLVEVAANLVARPQLLLLDEPAAGLSHEEHAALGERLRHVPERFGTTVVLIEHDLDLVRSVCSTITVLNFGEVLANGERDAVLADPAVIAAYMGDAELL